MQKLLDNHNNDIISDTIANGDKLNYKSIIRIDELKNAGIELKEANEEWIITGGKTEPGQLKRLENSATVSIATHGQGLAY